MVVFNSCFGIFQVSPSSNDEVTQAIRNALGDFSLVRPYLDKSAGLIGVDGVPPSPGPAPQTTSPPLRSLGGAR